MTRKDKFKPIEKKKTVMLSLVLLLIFSVGVTIAYLVSQTNPVVNTFSSAVVKVEIEENFNGITKNNIQVKNTGDTEAYIRVKLISYRVNDQGEKIGGKTKIPADNLARDGSGWIKHEGFYYFTTPVAPENLTNRLDSGTGINLIEYTDADGGKQVIEVMAEGIQSKPVRAHEEAWGVTISSGNVTDIGGGE